MPFSIRQFYKICLATGTRHPGSQNGWERPRTTKMRARGRVDLRPPDDRRAPRTNELSSVASSTGVSNHFNCSRLFYFKKNVVKTISQYRNSASVENFQDATKLDIICFFISYNGRAVSKSNLTGSSRTEKCFSLPAITES